MFKSNFRAEYILAVLCLSVLALVSFISKAPSSSSVISVLPAPRTQVAQLGDVTAGLVGWWKFDDGSGLSAVDSSGMNNTGTLLGPTPPSWVGGTNARVGSAALSFNGTNSVDFGNPAALNLGTGSFSYGMWVYATANNSSWDEPWNKGGGSVSGAGYDMELGADYWTANISDTFVTRQVVFSSTPLMNQWVHLFVVVDRSSNLMKAYVNGVLAPDQGSISISGFGSVSSSIRASISGASYKFSGIVDDVRVFGRALSGAEVAQIYAAAAPRSGAPVVTYVSVTGITSSSATINWITDQTADSQVAYGLTAAHGLNSVLNSSLVTQHSVTLSGLLANTVYNFGVISRNVNGTSFPNNQTFVTRTTGTGHLSTVYVSVNTGIDSIGRGILSEPFKSIQYAYNQAQPGDTIIVEPGTYTELQSASNGVGILLDKNGWPGLPITLRSQNNCQLWPTNCAVIDGGNISGHNSDFSVAGSYNVIDGFEIKNGFFGGIDIWSSMGNGDHNQIVHNVIHDNGSIGNPVGLDGQDGVYEDSGTHDNLYANNYIYHNGRTGSGLDHGLYLCGDNDIVINNILSYNSSMGLQVAGYHTVSNLKVYNNTFAGNGRSGIILWEALDGVDIRNNIFYSQAKYGIDSFQATGTAVNIDHNLFYGNGTGNWNLTRDGSTYAYTLTNNITGLDPLLKNGITDFHLLLGSKAINAGAAISLASPDFDGNIRPIGSDYDIGAYESPFGAGSNSYSLTVNVSTHGTVNSAGGTFVNCTTNCVIYGATPGTVISLIANPTTGYRTVWTGCTTSVGNSCSVSMQPYNVTIGLAFVPQSLNETISPVKFIITPVNAI